MNRPFRLFGTLLAALLVSVGVGASHAASRPEFPPSSAAPAAAGEVSAARAASSARAAKKPSSDYPLYKVPVASAVIMTLKDQYLDRSRFKPKEMLVTALKAVERKVAEVMVQGDAQSSKLTLTVGHAQHELDISGVTSIWTIRETLGEAMGFVQDHLVAKQDLREIEYEAVNGMLSTLDPHTQLLEPRMAGEMKVRVRGEFGGVGFVIGLKDGDLRVMKVLKSTPAQRAGIKARDVITRIDDHSTVNLDLEEAVDRLRGPAGTKVSVTVSRPGSEPKRLAITREMINIETITQARLLAGDVAYLRISEFTGHTHQDLRAALRSLSAQRSGSRLGGIVLDLRSNPGGLFEQAVQVSDLFLREGEIAKQVGLGQRTSHEARDDANHDVLDVPLVVIVNAHSASASEIVAGALKNNGRALVVGRQTFGKGSVQQLQDINDPEHGLPNPPQLKFTIAQYLTPGDLSIQETGITPDVMLVHGRALKDQVNVFAPPRAKREMDLEHHFQNSGDKGAAADPGRKQSFVERAPLELHYLLDEKEDAVARQLKREAANQGAPELTLEELEEEDTDPDAFVEDYQIRFAAELIRRAPYAVTRPHLLEAARALVAERTSEETSRLEKRLKELGVDWSSGSSAAAPAGTPRAVVTVSPSPQREQKAGDTVQWTVTVENKGDAPFRRLRAWTSCEKNGLFDRREFVFGTVAPGEKRSWTVPVKLPRGLDTRRDEIVFRFEDEAGKAPPDLTTTVAVLEVPRPTFAFSVQVDDRKDGNGDGLPQRGEIFDVRVDVKNAGTGVSGDKTYVLLKNEGDDKLFITKGRDMLGAMKPGEVRSATMQVELKRGSTSDTLPIRVSVQDERTEQFVTDELALRVAKDAPAAEPARGTVRVRAPRTSLRSGASPSAPVLAIARQGSSFPVEARSGDFYRVTWRGGRAAFLATADVATAPAGSRRGAAAEVWQHDPPRLSFTPDPAKGAPVVDAETIRVSGVASLPPASAPGARIRDLFIFVNEQKVFFKVLPDDAAASKLEFAVDVPLAPGHNAIFVFARESEDLQTMRSIVVHRRTPAVATEANRGPKAEERNRATP